jgi:hypothetical protein
VTGAACGRIGYRFFDYLQSPGAVLSEEKQEILPHGERMHFNLRFIK